MRYFFLLIYLVYLLPQTTQAASLLLFPEEIPVKTHELQSVTLSVRDSVKPLNAVEGKLTFNPEEMEFVEVKTNTSIISFWIEYPRLCDQGKVCFSGITPGGFGGGSHDVLSVVFLPKTAGTTTMAVDPIRLLQHDGKGTDEPVSPTLIQLLVEQNEYGDLESGKKVDIEPPEAFTPLIVTDPDLFGGAYGVLFTTVDKQSGITGYYIKEVPWWLPAWLSSWQEVTSPHRLNDQEREHFVYVKAVDTYGNERVMVIEPENTPWPPVPVIVVIGGVCMLLSLILLRRRQRGN